jgi:hypothetical protein
MLVVLQSLAAQEEKLVLGAPEKTSIALIMQDACSKYKINWQPNRTKMVGNLQPPVLSTASSKRASPSHNCLLKARYHGMADHIFLPVDNTANLTRLYSPQLPDKHRIMILVEEYFAHVHPLRCFGFVHKPSFMQRLHEDLDSFCNNESLLHIVCALGAKLVFNSTENLPTFLIIFRFLALDYTSQLSSDLILTAGNQWAKVAKARMFADLDDLNIEKLMVRPSKCICLQNNDVS